MTAAREQPAVQRSPAEIEALHHLIFQGALPDCLGPGARWDLEGIEHRRLWRIMTVLGWALGWNRVPEDWPESRETFLWLCGEGPCPVDERGHSPRFHVRSRKTA